MLFQERKDLTVLLTSVRRIHGRQFGVHRAPRGDLVWRVVDAWNLLSTIKKIQTTRASRQSTINNWQSTRTVDIWWLFQPVVRVACDTQGLWSLDDPTRVHHPHTISCWHRHRDQRFCAETNNQLWNIHTYKNQTNKQLQLQLQINIKLILSMM